jgi:hypothetical protein
MRKMLLVIVKKAPLLTDFQLERLASISADLAQVSVGSVVVPFLFDRRDSLMLVSGIVIAIFFGLASLFIERRRG